jgi:hypothetical protein
MFKIFYTESDTTLYQGAPSSNTGLDEILEIGKRYGTDGSTLYESRPLVKFNMPEITSALSKYSVNLSDCKFMLQLYTTDAKNLPSEYTITANVVAQPWNNGTGYFSPTNIVSNGATWTDNVSGSMWISSSQNIQYKSSSFRIAGSEGGGGSWVYLASGSYFNYAIFDQNYFNVQSVIDPVQVSTMPYSNATDINLDITDAVNLWISGSNVGDVIDNNGLLLRFSDADVADSNVNGYIRYFSRDTHTIYVPRLIMYWDNSTFTTGSLTRLNTDSYIVYTDIKPQYKDTEVVKIRVYARDKYPRKSPTNLSPYQTVKYLPTSSYYTVLDAATDEVIIPYDDIYNKISCDSTSNFIYIDMSGFMPERYYRLEFKLIDGITEQYITDSVHFKVIR